MCANGPEATLCVLGTGSLGRSVCYSIAATWRQPATVVVAGRNRRSAEQAAWVAGTRSALGGRVVRFEPAVVEPADADAMLGDLRPDVLLVCASVQSPWERIDAGSAWTDLLARAGFGLTLPLQARLVVALAEAVARSSPDTLLVNACYPDAVNPVLAALDLPVHCGIGNAAIVAASLQASLGLADQADLQVLAHHAHLHAPGPQDEEARAWSGTVPVPDVTARLAAQRACDRRELNAVTGFDAARVLEHLVSGRPLAASLPGPGGRPGGYPVTVRGREIELRLPPGVDEAAATGWNQRMAARDGVVVGAGEVGFAPAVQNALRPYLPDRAAGFPVTETEAVGAELLELRERLRGQPQAEDG